MDPTYIAQEAVRVVPPISRDAESAGIYGKGICVSQNAAKTYGHGEDHHAALG